MRGSWESWIANQARGMVERAQNEVERILDEHHVPPLENAQEKELDLLLERAAQEIKG